MRLQGSQKSWEYFFSTHHKFASATVDDSEIRRPAVVR